MGSNTIAGIIVVLGIITGFTILMYSELGIAGGPPTMTLAAAPAFSNPFDTRGYSQIAVLGEGYHYQTVPIVTNDTNRQCGNETFFQCLNDPSGPDYDATYAQSHPANDVLFNFSSGFYPDNELIMRAYAQGADWTRFNSFRVELWCRWSVTPGNGNTSIAVVFDQVLDSRNAFVFGANDQQECPLGTWGHVTFIDHQVFSAQPTDANAFMQFVILSSLGPDNGTLDVSTAYVQVFFSGATQCNGNGFFGDISCQFVNFGNWLIDLGSYGLNVVLFVGGWLWVAASFGIGLIRIIAWFYAIPGLPFEIQIFIDAVFSAFAFTLIFEIASLIRGRE